MRFLIKISIILSFFYNASTLANPYRVVRNVDKFLISLIEQGNFQKLRELIGLEMRYDLLKHTHPSSHPTLQKIINNSHFIEGAVARLPDLIEQDIYQKGISKPLLWKATDSTGKVHHILGVFHSQRLEHYSEEVLTNLTKIIDQSSVLLHEASYFPLRDGKHLTNIDSLYDTKVDYQKLIDDLQEVEDQITVLGVGKGKKVESLEDHLKPTTTTQKDTPNPFAQQIDTLEKMEENASTELDFLAIEETHEKLMDEMADAYTDVFIEEIYRRVSNYQHADVNELRKYHPHQKDDFFLAQRNAAWVEKILTTCREGNNCFIYAGADHMLVETADITSIITLLREQRFDIRLAE